MPDNGEQQGKRDKKRRRRRRRRDAEEKRIKEANFGSKIDMKIEIVRIIIIIIIIIINGKQKNLRQNDRSCRRSRKMSKATDAHLDNGWRATK